MLVLRNYRLLATYYWLLAALSTLQFELSRAHDRRDQPAG